MRIILRNIVYVSKTCWSVNSQEFGENILLGPFFLPIGCQNAVDLIRIILRDILYVSITCWWVDSQEFGENILLRPFFLLSLFPLTLQISYLPTVFPFLPRWSIISRNQQPPKRDICDRRCRFKARFCRLDTPQHLLISRLGTGFFFIF